ncbi:hypothetical protein CC1G_05338 [Coprinopsis cinerea okayama7|uniref:Uncharacterized protein n=1 Tax=Coprinopsis cinerea (strain Okayama-7 / 130 / ATCC MYA-4618 / FGSC 9003) TaxID=240176 RepID=A8NPQ7_COPC7|nr:hypothetical protein CC1G_05338 [Coprinopsis cinerea okayama7\|eukprot:XP_001835376.1 hypothetical protein CC1G_05338 [Coprinopsis cinerea okayama7\
MDHLAGWVVEYKWFEVWRARHCSLWKRSKDSRVDGNPLCFCLLAILVAHLVKIIDDDADAAALHAAFIFSSVAFNVIVTIAIRVSRLLLTNRRLAKSLPSWRFKPYRGVISIVVDSAVPLAVCGVARAAIEVFDIRITEARSPLVSVDTWFRLTIFGVFVDKLYFTVASGIGSQEPTLRL